MFFHFNQLLEQAGFDPARTRLLRHPEKLLGGRTPLDLWYSDRPAFETYQAYQLHSARAWFAGQHWASFACLPDGRTLFVGFYDIQPPVQLADPFFYEASGKAYGAGEIDFYAPVHSPTLEALEGRLFVDWGDGMRSWRQRADNQDKRITALHASAMERPFPGLMELVAPASEVIAAPISWREHLSAARGIYLLTCPRTGELYVGSANGRQGFWGRWMDYEADGHGGNVALKLRERSDWIVSILQVAGSTETTDDIVAAEQRWKRKLNSREFGLNRN